MTIIDPAATTASNRRQAFYREVYRRVLNDLEARTGDITESDIDVATIVAIEPASLRDLAKTLQCEWTVRAVLLKAQSQSHDAEAALAAFADLDGGFDW